MKTIIDFEATYEELNDYNSIKVGNLIYTGLNYLKIAQIKKGIKNKIDVHIYASNPKLDHFQMHEIRLGLEKKLPVNLYADNKKDWYEMRQCRLKLLKKLKNK